MNYRREIDGLRALAVLPVILFHAGFATFGGGFVGVDVFFVISGYLITSIILAEKEAGTFSLVNFYERRARRILPALLFVAAVCIPFAWLWLLPNDMKDFSQSLVAVSVFASNILFWHETGYFDTEAELKPLLHTWSLAVEEQYYVLFPLFIMLTWRLGKRWIVGLLVAIAVISLALAQVGAYSKPAPTFFLLPTRAWELAIGALSAFYLAQRQQVKVSAGVRQAASGTGLLLILCAVFAFSKSTPFPSLYALVPTIGTVLIILFTTPGTIVGTVLGSKAFVAVGLASYSAYLWHQPFFAFARHRISTEPSTFVLLLLSACAVVLAYFSWRFVERPFRNKGIVGKRSVLVFALTGSTALAVVGIAGHLSGGYANRVNEVVRRIAGPESGSLPECDEEIVRLKGETCVIGDTASPPTMAILGDSHSTRLTKELDFQLRNRRASAIVYAQSWCPPLIDLATDAVGKRPHCRQYVAAAYREIESNPKLEVVILMAEWALYTKGMRFGDAYPSFYFDGNSKEKSLSESALAFERSFERALKALDSSKKKILIVRSVPEYDLRIPDALAKKFHFDSVASIPDGKKVNLASYLRRNAEVEAALYSTKARTRAQVIDSFALLCPGAYCDYIDDDLNVFYTDGSHLSLSGSKRIVKALLDSIDGR